VTVWETNGLLLNKGERTRVREGSPRELLGEDTHSHYSRKGGHVGNLVDRGEESSMASGLAVLLQLLKHQGGQGVVQNELATHPHVGHKPLFDAVVHRGGLRDQIPASHFSKSSKGRVEESKETR